MGRYIAGRFLQLIPTLIGISIIAFVLVRMLGDPTALLLPPAATEAQRAEFRRAHGFDRPLPVQYIDYLGEVVQGDLGTSLSYHEPALSIVMHRLPATLELALGALVLVVPIGFAVGIVSGARRNSVVDWILSLGVLLGQSIATFWLGIMLILLFAVQWQIFPVSGRGGGDLRHLFLPALTLAAYMTAVIARLTRSGMLEVLRQDYIRTARAKGLRERVVLLRHVFRNTLIPVVTVLGLQLSNLIGGAVVTETVFQWPGVGTLVVDAISRRDYPIVQAAVLVLATASVLINLGVDILYGYLDPRIRAARS